MVGFIGRRLAQALLVLFGASIMVFLLVRVLPGDPVDILAAEEGELLSSESSFEHRWGWMHPFLSST